jgi:ABC-type multidrug transport system permease subunit
MLSLISIKQLESQLFQRESSIVGQLIQSKTSDSDAVVNMFVSGTSNTNAIIGAAALKRMGYTNQTSGLVFPFLNADITDFFFMLTATLVLLFIVFCFICYFLLSKVYKQINNSGRS